MKRWAHQFSTLLLIVTVLANGLHPSLGAAAITDCTALFSGSTITPGAVTNVNLQINNDSAEPIVWIKVSRPNASYVVRGATSQNFMATMADDAVIFRNGTIAGNTAYNRLNIDIEASANETRPATWVVHASSDPNGLSPLSCANAGLDLSISDGNGPAITDQSVTGITDTAATIIWKTDQLATSSVQYGLTSQYGELASNGNALSLDHRVTLSGLTASTAYHYKIQSMDGADNLSETADSTYVTSSTPSAPLPPNTIAPITTRIAVKIVPTERTPPSVALVTDLSKPYKSTPLLSGTAIDNDGIADIQYSLDDGRNWLPVTTITNIGTKSVTYNFTPIGLLDGNYPVSVRAIDLSGNTAATPSTILIIDRLEPVVGGYILTQGPQIMTPDSSGQLTTVTGIDHKITLSAVGGPTSIILHATRRNTNTSASPGASKPIVFNLTKSADSGLWGGLLSFGFAGTYSLTAESIDGAGNRTSQTVVGFQVITPGRTTADGSSNGVPSTVTLYYREPQSQSWVLWDGSGYNLANPQKTGKDGAFEFFVPAGTYYLKAAADDHRTVVSRIFTVSKAGPITTNIVFARQPTQIINRLIQTWPLPSVQAFKDVQQFGNVSGSSQIDNKPTSHSLIGKQLPEFSLRSTDGTTIRPADLLGRPTLISFISTWLPTASQQVSSLGEIQPNKDLNIVPIAVQENIPKIVSFNTVSGVKLRWLVDPDNQLSRPYGAALLPAHYIIDRKGIVRQIVTDTLSQQHIESLLSQY